MKKLIFVLLMVAICSLAVSAKNSYYNFTFRDPNGGTYCDGMYLMLYTPSPGVTPKTLVDGYHWNSDCGGSYANVNGFKAGVSPYYQYNALGAPMIVGSPVGGNGSAGGTQLIYLVNITYHTWCLWVSGGGAGQYVYNYGTWINGKAPVQGTKPSYKP